MSELARRYAQALYPLFPEEGALRTAAGVLTGSPALWGVLTDPTVRPASKRRVLDRVLADAPAELVHFFDVLCDKGRMALLPGVLAEFHALALADRGAALCVMTCVRPPDEAQKRRLAHKLARLHHKSGVELDVRLDPTLVGGFVLDIDGVTYDRSVRGRLKALERQLEGRREA